MSNSNSNSNKSQTNTPFNNNNNNNNTNFGINPNKIKKLNSPKIKDKSIGYLISLNKTKLSKKYLKRCTVGQEPYKKVKAIKTASKNLKPTKINFSKPYDFPNGLIIPLYKQIFRYALIPKMRRPICYKEETEIKDGTAKFGEDCYKDSHCIKGYCNGAFLRMTKGKCKKSRKKKNVIEGEPCKINIECKEGLECVNNWGGIKLGYCKTKKNLKLS